jgi:hypothetical protein
MQKLELAQKLNSDINELETFLPLAEQGGAYNTKHNEQNRFSGLKISARMWTGSDNPSYTEFLENPEIIKELMDMAVPLIKAKIAQKKAELELLFK